MLYLLFILNEIKSILKVAFFIAKKLIFKQHFQKKSATPVLKIAIFAIAIAVIMMLVSVATGVGLQHKIREKIAAFNGHLVVSNFDNNQSDGNEFPIKKTPQLVSLLKNNNEITSIQATATKAGLIKTKEAFEGIFFKGVDASFNWQFFDEYIINGKRPNFEKNQNEVIISQYLANRLNVTVGDKLPTFFIKSDQQNYNLRTFKIAGIYNSGFQDFDKTHVLGHLKHVQKMNKWAQNEVGQLEIFVDSFDNLETISEIIYHKIPSTYNCVSIKEKYISIFQWLQLFDFNIVVILIIMMVVASINMIVALLVLILEKTNFIGIMKAMGADASTIKWVFLYQAIYLMAKGILIGNIVALGLIKLQEYGKIIQLDAENYYVTYAPVALSFVHWFAINVGVLLICFITLWLPAVIIGRMNPIKAIQHQ